MGKVCPCGKSCFPGDCSTICLQDKRLPRQPPQIVPLAHGNTTLGILIVTWTELLESRKAGPSGSNCPFAILQTGEHTYPLCLRLGSHGPRSRPGSVKARSSLNHASSSPAKEPSYSLSIAICGFASPSFPLNYAVSAVPGTASSWPSAQAVELASDTSWDLMSADTLPKWI